MKYRPLGRTGLFVSELCLGTMTFGGSQDPPYAGFGALDQRQATALLGTAFDAGINFVDTADVYSHGESERLTGRAIRDCGVARDDIVVATKAYSPMGSGPNNGGSSRRHLIEAAEASLARMGLDHVDLYQLHGFDPATPIEETLAGLEWLVQRGHVRYVGVSNWAAWQVAKALGIAERRGWSRCQSVQAYYSVADRDIEREIVPMLDSEGVGLMVWSPLAGGLLSGKYDPEGLDRTSGRRSTFRSPPIGPSTWGVIEAMRPVASAHRASLAQVAIAWLLGRSAVTSVIVGARSHDQLIDNLAAPDLVLEAGEIAGLDDAGALRVEYPQWVMERQVVGRRDQLAASRPSHRPSS